MFLSMSPRYFAPTCFFSEFIHVFATYLNDVIDSQTEAIVARIGFYITTKTCKVVGLCVVCHLCSVYSSCMLCFGLRLCVCNTSCCHFVATCAVREFDVRLSSILRLLNLLSLIFSST